MTDQPNDSSPMPQPLPRPLNEHQQRHLYFGLVQLDKLLSEIENIQASAASPGLFPKYRDDLTLVQRKFLHGSIARLRMQLEALLRGQGMQPDPPHIDASGAIRTNLVFAEITAEDLGPANMRGYGDMDAEQSRELEGVISELRHRIEALLKELSAEPDAQLEQRIAQLEPSPGRDLLAAMENITRERGMLEFRAGLNLAWERLAAPAMEIAVFGRVSCGKSSLLNYLLGADVLPTGATPITAVPTRIGYGPTATVTARLEKAEKRFDIAQLAELASERLNPDNRLGITQLTVTYPSPKLRQGVLFVDTPGLGSIRSWGAMETLAYLPRSDMAILLVDAGSTLGSDELELVRWLHQGGIPVQVLLSKADLVGPEELEEGMRFTAQTLAEQIGGTLGVRAVSVRRAEMADAWFEADVLPLYSTLRQRFQISIGRRLTVLRDAIMAASGGRGAGTAAVDADSSAQLGRQLRLSEAAGDKAADAYRNLAQSQEERCGEAVVLMAQNLAVAWQERPAADTDTLRGWTGEALGKAMVELSRGARATLMQLGETYGAALVAARQMLPTAPAEEESFAVRDMPLPETSPVAWDVAAPRWSRLGQKRIVAHFQRQLESHEPEIAAALRAYGLRLQQWGLAAQAEMQRRFQARADIARATLQRWTGAPAAAAPLDSGLRAALTVLEQWKPAEAAEVSALKI